MDKVEPKLAENNVFLSLVTNRNNATEENRDQTTRALRALTGYRVIDALAAAFLKEPKKSLHVECNLSPAMISIVDSARSKSWVDSLGLTTNREIDWRGHVDLARAAYKPQHSVAVPAFPDHASASSLLTYAVDCAKGNAGHIHHNLTIAAALLRYLCEMEDPCVPEKSEEFLALLKLTSKEVNLDKGANILAPILVAAGISPCLLLANNLFVYKPVAAANITRIWFRGVWERNSVTEGLERSMWEAICMIAFDHKTPQEALGYFLSAVPAGIENIKPSRIVFLKKPREQQDVSKDTPVVNDNFDTPSPMHIDEPWNNTAKGKEPLQAGPRVRREPLPAPISQFHVRVLEREIKDCKPQREERGYNFYRNGESVWHLGDMVYADRKWDFECLCPSMSDARELEKIIDWCEEGKGKVPVEVMTDGEYSSMPLQDLLGKWQKGVNFFVYDEIEARKPYDKSELTLHDLLDIFPTAESETIVIQGAWFSPFDSSLLKGGDTSDQGGVLGNLVKARVDDVMAMLKYENEKRRTFKSVEIPHTDTKAGWRLKNRIALEKVCWRISQNSQATELASYSVASKYASWDWGRETSGLAVRLEMKQGVAICVIGHEGGDSVAFPVVLKKGMTLMVGPDTPYKIYMREPGIIYKDNFLAWPTMGLTVRGVLRTLAFPAPFPGKDKLSKGLVKWMRTMEVAEVVHEWIRGIIGTLVKVHEPRGWPTSPGSFRQLIPDIMTADGLQNTLAMCFFLFLGSTLYPGDYISFDMREKMMHGRDLGLCLVTQLEELLVVTLDGTEEKEFAYKWMGAVVHSATESFKVTDNKVGWQVFLKNVDVLYHEYPKFAEGVDAGFTHDPEIAVKGTRSGADTSVLHLRHTMGYSSLEWFELSQYKRYQHCS
ncbi:hypothetical protein NP233_g11779 [Leucocoprinus birnbaumii]|uniref:Uncharacterized protein n=1 Tax=Leucocoprinus birnbaumii TaxID=56174 RepID=A0AAD5VHF9_9AGAR|nr:hypothetical protein NP233_g11779 [Leucocoprinus birnbaumii]